MVIIQGYLINLALYAILVVPAALARRARLFAWLIGLHVVIYLAIAALSAVFPNNMMANAYAAKPAAEAAR